MASEHRLIDANRISYHPSGFPKGDGFDSRLDWAFREDIDKAPTVDAVEVVRCKDCKHWSVDQYGCVCNLHSEKENADYPAFEVQMLPTDFCSYGERREA